MKGYKGFDSNLMCRGFQYKVGETFTMDEPISLCKSGYHFCVTLSDTFKFYYPDENNVYCEIEASGEIQKGDGKYVCSQIKIIKKIPKLTINRARYGDGNGDGYGYSCGYSCGFGCGCGCGYGNGDSYSFGFGCGYGYGKGYINGFGNGCGYGDGYGYGDGDGSGCGYSRNIYESILLK